MTDHCEQDLTEEEWALFTRYIDGEATLEERGRAESCLRNHAAFASDIAQLQASRIRAKEMAGAFDADAAFAIVVKRARADHRKPTLKDSAQRARQTKWNLGTQILRRRGYTFGGVVFGVMVILAGWYAKITVRGAGGQPAVSIYETEEGQRANITLPDGNTVALNVASRLSVPADYMAGNHTVRLLGEALFTVSHHEGKPFTVIAGTAVARVLGTSFAVRHYATDTAATVMVREGKVAVGDVVVPAAQSVEVALHGDTHLRPTDLSQFGFATGVLMMNVTPLSQAIPELNRWYDADIRLGDSSFARVPIEGTFAAGSLSDLTAMLEWMLNARVIRDGRVLTLYAKVK